VVNGGNIFAGTRGGVFLSTNNGTSWTTVSAGITDTMIYSLAVAENEIFAGTDDGVFISTDNGTSWTAVATGLTNTRIRTLIVCDGTIYAGTWGGGVWRRPLSEMTGIIISKPKQSGSEQIKCSIFAQNPAEPTVVIAFELFHSDKVTIGVYTTAGKKMAMVVNKKLGPGCYRYLWNARKNVAGCYKLKVQVGNRIYTESIPVLQ
jgi:hypothetical protein